MQNQDRLSPYCRNSNLASLHVINCCLDSCKDHIDYCFDQCKDSYGKDESNLKRCSEQCVDLIKNCESGCLEIPSIGLDVVKNCAKEKGCGHESDLDLKCMRKNKQDILTCCKDTCIPNQHVDCQGDLCEDFFNYIVEKKTRTLYNLDSYWNSSVLKPKVENLKSEGFQHKDKKKTNKIILVTSIILLVFLGLVFFFLKMKN